MAYIISIVRFSDGKSEEAIITYNPKTHTPDQAHHAHQREESEFWGDFKSVVGGQYQAVDGGLVEALIAAHPNS